MHKDQETIKALKVLCDVLSDFERLIENLEKTSEKHGMPLSQMKNFNLSDPESLKSFTHALSTEKLGLLVRGLADIADLKEGMKNFMTYDQKQLTEFKKNLKTSINKFNEALAES